MNITCACKICKANATHLGIAFPLAATVTTTQGQKFAATNTHYLVHAAFSPSAMGRADRKKFGVEPIGYTHKTDAEVREDAIALIAAVRSRNGN